MNNSRLLCLIVTCIFTFFSTSSNAELDYQANGTVWDTDLDIYWLQDASLAKSEQFGLSCSYINCVSGGMNYYFAVGDNYGPSYIVRMNEYNKGTGWKGYNNWRLPTQTEFEHLYRDELGNTFGMPLINTGEFNNVQSGGFYWTGDLPVSGSLALGFSFSGGSTLPRNKQFNDHFVWPVRDGAATVNLSGTIKADDNADICAMVLASGKFMFSCNPVGVFSLSGLPREQDGTVKRQIYADGFFPKIDILTGSTNAAVVMTRSGTCPNYNTPYDPGVFPDSAGKRINISGKVLLQDSQTPICAMVLANGQYMFTCDGTGNYALNIPLDSNGQFKLQVYADGFAPITQKFDEFQAINIVRMARAVECQ